MNKFHVCMILALLPCMLGYRHFQDQIPNGNRVPHPCKTNNVWHGVGHMNKEGGGMRNLFGQDFERNGYKWDKCLCHTDSDKDGKTNGEELGDPDCEWEPGMQPKITALSNISHPGVCDPHDSEKCKEVNNWEFCDVDEFNCEPLKAAGVKNFTMRFPPTPVPAEETTYVCMMLDIPTEGDWHIIGNQPEIDNDNVMHHIIVRLCSDEAVAQLGGKFDSPTACGMASDSCEGFLVGWTVGLSGYCYGDNYGTPLGKKTGFTKALVQLHWNNPEIKEDYVDSSGITFFYEDKRRQYDSGRAITGSITLNIPPKQLYFEQSSLCSSECTRTMLQDTKNIVSVLPHMHYLGRGMIVEHWRNKERLPDLVNMNNYAYDNPTEILHDPPVVLQPGDEVITRCYFNTMNQERRIYFGESTQAEMCLAFIMYYPDLGKQFRCIGAENHTFCNIQSQSFENNSICNITEYFLGDLKGHYAALAGVCDPEGLECRPGCQETLDTIYQHPCMQGDTLYSIKARLAFMGDQSIPFLHFLHSCHHYEVHVPEKNDVLGELCERSEETDDATVNELSYGIIIAATLCKILFN